MNCQICGRTITRYVGEYHFNSRIFREMFPEVNWVGICDSCKLHQIEIENTADNQNKLYRYYSSVYREETLRPDLSDKKGLLSVRGEGISQLIKKHLPACNTCFEKGAGFGFNLMAIHRAYPNARLFTDEMDEHAEGNLRAGGIEKRSLEFETRYDAIIMSHVFEHLLDCNDVIKLCWNRLREKGILYLEVPNSLNYVEPHITFWTKESLLTYYNTNMSDLFELKECYTIGIPYYYRSIATKAFYRALEKTVGRVRMTNVKTANGVYLRALFVKRGS